MSKKLCCVGKNEKRLVEKRKDREELQTHGLLCMLLKGSSTEEIGGKVIFLNVMEKMKSE